MRRSTRAVADPDMSLDDLKREAERSLRKQLGTNAGPREIAIFNHAVEQLFEHENPAFFKALGRLTRMPVTIDEFVQSKEFIGDLMEVWPTLMLDLRNMNPDVLKGEPPCTEVLFGGATGTGKTYTAQITQMYQLYLLTCFYEPQRLFGLAKNTPLVFMMQSVSTTITKRVIYDPFRANFLAMPYSRQWIKFDKWKESELEIEGNLLVVPAQAQLQAMVGQAIPSAILDEINFMQIIEVSKQAAGPAGMGGRFDQAEIVYSNISRRRKRSFTTRGVSIGCICVVSSTRYKGDFLDRRIDEVRVNEETGILALRRKQYDVVPKDRYCGKRFRVLVGNDDYPTRVLEDDEQAGVHYPDSAEVELVPVEFRPDFLRDPEGAQRDVIGIASNAISPFITRREKIVDAVLAGRDYGLKPWVAKMDVDLQTEGMPQILEGNLPKDRHTPRFVHIDLSSSRDPCGIGIVREAGKTVVLREDGLKELLPVWMVEAAIQIRPSATHHIDPSEVRQWIMRLVRFHEINVVCVSYDGFQSNESVMLFRKSGIQARNVSVDRTMEPYTMFRRALYDDRMIMTDSEVLRRELAQLEIHKTKNKVDHPPKGTKDVADGVSGAIFNASTWRGAGIDTGVIDDQGQPVLIEQVRQRPSGLIRPPGRRLNIDG